MKMTTTKSLLLLTLTLITLSGCGKTPPADDPVKTPPAEVTPAPAAPVPTPVAPVPASAVGQMVPLELKLPRYRADGTPNPIEGEPNMEPAKPEDYRRPAFYVPKGTTNLARGKDVTASEEPIVGELAQLVDSNAESTFENFLDLGFGPVWVTVDLGTQCEIFAILSWHRHNNQFAFRDVVIETADDKDFATNRQILFNNDHDGSLDKGHGKGAGKQYVETCEGKLIDAKGIKARYVRFWSNGSSYDNFTYWIEAQVFGRELK